MVDLFALGVSHGLMAIGLWRLLMRDDLDQEVTPRQRWQQDQTQTGGAAPQA